MWPCLRRWGNIEVRFLLCKSKLYLDPKTSMRAIQFLGFTINAGLLRIRRHSLARSNLFCLSV